MKRDYYLNSGGILSKIKGIFLKEVPKFPQTILLETQSGCNARCIFCPYSEKRDKLPSGKMKDDLFEKIVQEFSIFTPKYIIPCFTNEPLLDKNLYDKLLYIKERSPKTKIKLTTNGSLLNEKLIEKLLKPNLLYEITVSFNGFRKETFEYFMRGLSFKQCFNNLLNLLNYVNKNKLKRPKIIVNMLQIASIKSEIDKAKSFWESKGAKVVLNPIENRGGSVKEKKDFSSNFKRNLKCRRPFNTAVITFDGKMVLCCVDYERKVILGDLKNQSIYEVWNSPLLNEIRKKLLEGRLEDIPICRDCKIGEFN